MEALHLLKKIEYKVRHLLEQNEQLRKERDEAIQNYTALKSEMGTKKEVLTELDKKILNLQFSNSGEVDPSQKDELRKKLDEYIKEVDKCIAKLKSEPKNLDE